MPEEVKKISIESINWDTDTRLAIGSFAPLLKSLELSLRKSTDKIIDSNERLAVSNEKHSHAMKWLTAALVGVAVAQAFFTYAQYKVAGNAISEQAEANSIERSKWDYEMMRNDRLEARDVDWRRQDLERGEK